MGRDWIDWHSSYDDPSSSMGARLVAVVDEVRRALLDAPPGPFRLASPAGPGGWAVGAERFEGPAQAVTSGLRLFRFRDDLW